MKKLITILLLISNAKAQYTAIWTRSGAKVDSIQQSIDAGNWKTILTIVGGQDSTNIPGPVYYYRVKSGKYVTNSVLVYNLTPITITNINCINKILSFTTANEDNSISYYGIEESTDGQNFIQTETILPKGDGNYSIKIL